MRLTLPDAWPLLERPASGDPLLLRHGRSVLTVDDRSGVGTLANGARSLLGAVEILVEERERLVPCHALRVSATGLGIRRELAAAEAAEAAEAAGAAGAAGSEATILLEERLALGPGPDTLVAAWTASRGLALRVRVRLPGGAAAARNAPPPAPWVWADVGQDRLLAWRTEEGGAAGGDPASLPQLRLLGDRLEAIGRLEAGSSLILVATAAAGAAAEPQAILQSAMRALRARAGEARRAEREGLRLSITGAPEASIEPEVVGWARQRLADGWAGGGPSDAPDPVAADLVLRVSAALALGDPQPARALLRARASRPGGSADGWAGQLPALLGRYVAWTGDHALAAAVLRTAAPIGGDGTAHRSEAGGWPDPPDLFPPLEAPGEVPALSPERLYLADPVEAATVAYDLVHGLAGAEPDATRTRLKLAPAERQGMAALELGPVSVGDAAVRLSWRCDRRAGVVVHRLEASQERGPVPLTLILEPRLLAAELRQARVDGRPAQLMPRQAGDRLGVPVQLVLDASRLLELEVTGAA